MTLAWPIIPKNKLQTNHNTELYNKSQKRIENVNIFDKEIKTGKPKRNTFKANNIADTNTYDSLSIQHRTLWESSC